MKCRFALGVFFTLAVFLPSSAADTLEQLRQNYQKARDDYSKIENPEIGSEGFREKLKDWAEAKQTSQESARALVSALLEHWINLPDDKAVRIEIKAVFKDLAGDSHTEQYSSAKSFFARIAWPLLANNKLTKEQAELLAELTKRPALSRINDLMSRFGQPTEAHGWDVQAAYALALIRCGKEKQARSEISSLHAKVSANYKSNPDGGLDQGLEAGDARLRNYIDYLQLCWILEGLQDAISNDYAGAKERVKQARRLRKNLSPESRMLIAEFGHQGVDDID